MDFLFGNDGESVAVAYGGGCSCSGCSGCQGCNGCDGGCHGAK